MDERDIEYEELIAFALVSLFEELEFSGVLPRTTVNRFYVMIGNHCGLISLLPTKRQDNASSKGDNAMATNTQFDLVILTRRKDQYVDEKYLKFLHEKGYTSCTGFAVARDGRVAFNAVPAAIPIEGDEGLVNTQTVFNENCVMCFGKSSTDWPDEELQPFTLLENGTEKDEHGNDIPIPVLMAFGEGEFPEHRREGQKNSPFYLLCEEYLKEKINELWESSNKNIDVVMEKIGKGLTGKEIHRTIGNGCIIFIGGNGVITPFVAGEKGWAEFGWGTTSNILDYHSTAGQGTAEAKKAGRGLMSMLKGATSGTAPPAAPAAPAVAEPPRQQPQQPAQPQKTADLVSVGSNGKQMIVMPETLVRKGPEQRASWIARHFDFGKDAKTGRPLLPQGWEKMRGFPVENLRKESTLRERMKSFTELAPAIEAAHRQVTSEVLPIMSPAERDEAKKIFNKYMPGSDLLWDTSKIESVATQSPSFSEQTGIPLACAARVPLPVYWEMIQKDPKSMYALVVSLRNLINDFIPDELDAELEAAAPKTGAEGKRVTM